MLDSAEKCCARCGNEKNESDCHCSSLLEERGIDVTYRKETNPDSGRSGCESCRPCCVREGPARKA